jgi:adenylylsulfate kinase-like enzyme
VGEDEGEEHDFLFEQVLKGETHQFSSLEQLYELPLYSELELKAEGSDTNTSKTVKSDVAWT